MPNTALGRSNNGIFTNKSGGAHAQGDVVVLSGTTAAAVKNDTSGAYVDGIIGVCMEPNGVADNAQGLYTFGGYVSKINLSGSASLADLFKTHTVAKQAVRHAAPAVTGDFGIVLGTGATPAAWLFGKPQVVTEGGGGGGAATPVVDASGKIFANTNFR